MESEGGRMLGSAIAARRPPVYARECFKLEGNRSCIS
jgi:hypothetical protein